MSDLAQPDSAKASAQWCWELGFGAIVVLALACFPLLIKSQYQLFIATQVGVYLMVAIGLNFLTGFGGQASIGHGALMAIGAYTAAILMVDHLWSFWPAAGAGMVLTALGGALMALPAFRVSTWYFALITLGFAHVVSGMLVEWGGLTHSFDGIVGIPMPSLFGASLGPRGLFWLVAGLNVIAFIIVRNLVRSRIGRGLIAVRDNPAAAMASGVSLVGVKMFAFVFSAVLAGLAGALFAVQKTVITPDDFTAEFSIFFLVVVVLGGAGRLWGPIIGTLVFFVVPEFLEALQGWRLLVYGVVLLALMRFAPSGLVGAIDDLWQRSRSSRRVLSPVMAFATQTDLPVSNPAALDISGLSKRFGGVAALSDVSIAIRAGSVHAIVGPNGSGKTTLLNLVSGYYKADAGSALLDGNGLLGRSPVAISRRGIGRTFQTPKLLPDLTVIENAMLGGYAFERASLIEVALRLPRHLTEARRQRRQAAHYLRFVGLENRLLDKAGDLPHGQQRLAEIARALVGNPRLLLLDEPAAGLSMDELDRLGALIKAIVAQGTTIVIVEHHLDLVGAICETVTVLDRGTVLAAGTPERVFADPAVLSAYMGSHASVVGTKPQ
jgi:ABC-type branched-subunit amino acid transport system ATPase component/ABC-type branched-subunit amino acid transport system permease subunit